MSHLTERLNVGGALTGLLFGHRDRDRIAFAERAAAMRDVLAARNVTFVKAELFVAALGVLGYATICLVGGLPAAREAATVGTVVALVGLVKLAYDPLIAIVQRGLDLPNGLVAFERAMAEPREPVRLKQVNGRVEFPRRVVPVPGSGRRDVAVAARGIGRLGPRRPVGPGAERADLDGRAGHDDGGRRPDRRWQDHVDSTGFAAVPAPRSWCSTRPPPTWTPIRKRPSRRRSPSRSGDAR